MKKLITASTLACAITLFFTSCSKDPIAEPDTSFAPPLAVQSISVKSNVVDVYFNGYASLLPSTRYILSVNRVMIDEFTMNGATKKKWQFSNLKAGDNEVMVTYSPLSLDNLDTYSFHFDVKDPYSTQGVSSSGQPLGTYRFKIQVTN
jgi:hypothetical protein